MDGSELRFEGKKKKKNELACLLVNWLMTHELIFGTELFGISLSVWICNRKV